jgi:hypothetical protein
MAESFVGIEVAVIVVTASVVLAGILIGIGRAFGYKRIEHFGMEELIQSIINSAIIGSFAAVIELVAAVSSSVVTETCSEGNVVNQLSCTLGTLNTMLFSLFQEMVKMLNILGYYQSLSLDFGAFSISPFTNLASVTNVLSLQLLSLNWIMILVELNNQITTFIGQNALGLLFPVGLVLRTLFATRRVGGFLIALSIGLFIFYPTFILVFPNPVEDINQSSALMANFTNNSYYATMPVIDLNDNYAIAGKLDILSGRCGNMTNITNVTGNVTGNETGNETGNGTNMTNATVSNCEAFLAQQQNLTSNQSLDFSGDLTLISQTNSNTLAKSLLYAVIAPLFSLVITIVFVRELANILGSEIGIRTIASI